MTKDNYSMKSVGFFVKMGKYENLDLSKINEGNPGIGGTEYMYILLFYFFSTAKLNFVPILYTDGVNMKFPLGVKYTFVEDENDAKKKALRDNVEFLVVRSSEFENVNLIKDDRSNLKYVIWCHNFITADEVFEYTKNPNVICVINVGREQLDIYRDHNLFKKSTYIYNGFCFPQFDCIKNQKPYKNRAKDVVYVGAIVKTKNFHHIAQIWKNVIKKTPEARLHIIGSGRLWSVNEKLGEFNIAEEKYEKSFIKYITDDNGKLLDSIIFHGIMGAEKCEILTKCRCGVALGEETFGYTALEMQMCGCEVVALRCHGYMDTVCKKENLYSNLSELENKICKILNENDCDSQPAMNYIKQFDYKETGQKWIDLINILIDKRPITHEAFIVNPNFKHKQLKENMRKLKEKCGLFKIIPSAFKLHYIKRQILVFTYSVYCKIKK